MVAPKRPRETGTPWASHRVGVGVDQRRRHLGRRRAGPGGPVAASHVAQQRELAHAEQLRPGHVAQRQVEGALRTGQDAQAHRLVGQAAHVVRRPSPAAMPTSASRPGPMEAIRSPSTSTVAQRTLCSTTRTARIVVAPDG